jgi:uncharacterized protein (DUF302 family)
MIETTNYGLRRTIPLPYDTALEKTRAALQQEGFGILTEIDIRGKLKEKLGADFRRYTILGACNPPLAHRALQAELDIGLLLPCNVVVFEDGGGSVVAAIDPQSMVAVTQNEAMRPIADEARQRLERALNAV